MYAIPVLIAITIMNTAIAAAAPLPGYENTLVRYVSYIVETRQHETALGQMPRDQSSWQEVFVDLASGSGATRVIPGDQKPNDFSQPDLTIALNGEALTMIDHQQQSVLIESLTPRHFDGASFLFAGRVHFGFDLTAAIRRKYETEPRPDQPQTLVLESSSANAPVEITINQTAQVISLIDSERVYRFEWTREPDSGFHYVEHVQATYDFGFRRIEHQEWVRDITVYNELPKAFFQIEWPPHYTVEDRRSETKPPQTLSKP